MPDNLKKSNETFQIIYFLKAYSYEHAKIRKIHYHNDIFRLFSGPGQLFCLEKSFEKKNISFKITFSMQKNNY